MSVDQIQFIECTGSPRVMGQQYGEQVKEDILNNVGAFGVDRESRDAEAFRGNACRILRRFTPDLLDELTGMSEGSGVPLGALLRLNQVNTFEAEVASPGCTSMAISKSQEGSVLGKNNDWIPDNRRFVIRSTVPDIGHRMIEVTYTGWISGLDAMNSAGLVNGHNSVGSVFDKTGERLDIRLWGYHLMRHCSTTADFVSQIDAVPLTGKGFNIVVTDMAGDTCVLEAAVPQVLSRDRGRDFVYATNHYASEALQNADRRTPEEKPISVYRLGYLRWRDATSPPRTAGDIAGILTSHEPWAPCRHGGIHGAFTLWSMMGLPAKRCLRVASGPPCIHGYTEYEL